MRKTKNKEIISKGHCLNCGKGFVRYKYQQRKIYCSDKCKWHARGTSPRRRKYNRLHWKERRLKEIRAQIRAASETEAKVKELLNSQKPKRFKKIVKWENKDLLLALQGFLIYALIMVAIISFESLSLRALLTAFLLIFIGYYLFEQTNKNPIKRIVYYEEIK